MKMKSGYFALLWMQLCFCLNSAFRLVSTRRSSAFKKISLTKMSIFDRSFRVGKSNLNVILKFSEDPELVIDLAVNEMQNDLIKIKNSYTKVYTAERKLDLKRDLLLKDADDWYKRAALALKNDDEELAKYALFQRLTYLDSIEDLEKQLLFQRETSQKLLYSLQDLEEKIDQAKRQKQAYIGRARAAKTAIKINDLLADVDIGRSSTAALERLKDKADTLEALAEVSRELSEIDFYTSVSMEDRFRAMEKRAKVDEEMDRIMKDLKP